MAIGNGQLAVDWHLISFESIVEKDLVMVMVVVVVGSRTMGCGLWAMGFPAAAASAAGCRSKRPRRPPASQAS